MPYIVKLSQAALKDINEIFLWYNDQSTDLGYRFIDCCDKRLLDLSLTPKSGSIRYDNIRCTLIKIFPYQIHYSVDENSQTITVYRTFHISKKPLWENK